MDFIQELKEDLFEYEKVYFEIRTNPIFTRDEEHFVATEIKKLKEILAFLGELEK